MLNRKSKVKLLVKRRIVSMETYVPEIYEMEKKPYPNTDWMSDCSNSKRYLCTLLLMKHEWSAKKPALYYRYELHSSRVYQK